MASYNKIYGGSDNGLNPAKDILYSDSSRVAASTFGLTTDPRSAAQIKSVFEKLRTGAKSIEVTGVSAEILESIPKQHFDEIRRLKQLAGSEISFHAPVLEASGVTKQGWEESHRVQAESQMTNAVNLAQRMGTKEEKIVVTFHSSALPELETRIPTKTGERITEIWVSDDKGHFTQIKPEIGLIPEKEPGTTKDKVNEYIERQNREFWNKTLSTVNFHAVGGKQDINHALSSAEDSAEKFKSQFSEEEIKKIDSEKAIMELYKKLPTPEGQKKLQTFSEPVRNSIMNTMERISHGKSYIFDAYNEMESLFRRAVKSLDESDKSEDKKKLEVLKNYAEDFKKKNKDDVYFKDPAKLKEFADEVSKGVNLLTSIQPKLFRSMNEFVTDKSSETFANVALNSYKNYVNPEKGTTAALPIISIENPPAGMGLSRGEDLKELVIKSREKFEKKAQKSKNEGGLGKSAKEAKELAEKMIGATWDVGHINMLRKYGYKDTALIEESKKIAPYLKHIHLSDNFGYEHTEMPMGMGNVPMAGHLKALGEKAKKVKQIVETGQWYQYFYSTPLKETLEAFGSPIYANAGQQNWTQPGVSGITGTYSGGGTTGPEIHQSIYGAGFSGLPPELGGQSQGKSRFSGTPME